VGVAGEAMCDVIFNNGGGRSSDVVAVIDREHGGEREMGENERKLTPNLLTSSSESERSWRTRDLTSESWRPAVKKTKLTSPESCPCSNWEGDSKETSAARRLDTKAHAGSLSGHAGARLLLRLALGAARDRGRRRRRDQG